MKQSKYLTKENLLKFIDEQGLRSKCEDYCKQLAEAEQLEMMATPIPMRKFRWKGHYTKCCYELSGERFNHSDTFEFIIMDKELIPIDYSEPDNDSDLALSDSEIRIKDSLVDCLKFNYIKKRLLDFCDGDLGEADAYYDFDQFGFEQTPTDSELVEWLGNLIVDKDEFYKSNPSDCFLPHHFKLGRMLCSIF